MKIANYIKLGMFISVTTVTTAAIIPDIIIKPSETTLPTLAAAPPSETLMGTVVKRYQTLIQALNGKSAIQLTSLYGDGSHATISMRGFGDNANMNNLTMLNGEEATWPDISDVNFSTINLNDIAHITIFPGSDSVLYGDQAVGGIINIDEKKPSPHERTLLLQWGSYFSRGVQALLGDIFVNGWGYRLSVNSWQSDNYRYHNLHKSRNVVGVVSLHQLYDDLLLRYRFNHDNLQYPGALTAQQVIKDPRQANTTTDFSSRDNNGLSLQWQHQFSSYWHSDTKFTLLDMQGNGVLTNPFTESRRLWALNPKLNGTLRIGNQALSVIVGAHFAAGRYNFSSALFQSLATQQQQALYSQLTIPLSTQTNVVAGDRYAFAEDKLPNSLMAKQANYHVNVTNIEWDWRPDTTQTVFLRRAESFRFAKAEENALTQNNQLLQPQTGISYEAGWRYKKNNVTDLLLLGYQLNLRHEIMFVPDVTNQTPGYNQNLPPSERYGIVARLRYWLTPAWQVDGSYNWTNAEFTTGSLLGKRVPFVAKNTWQWGSDWYLTDNIDWLLQATYIGNRYPGADVANIATRLGGYMLYNSALGYHWHHFTTQLRVDNIADKRYYAYASAIYTNGTAATYYYPAAGRTFWLSLRWQAA